MVLRYFMVSFSMNKPCLLLILSFLMRVPMCSLIYERSSIPFLISFLRVCIIYLLTILNIKSIISPTLHQLRFPIYPWNWCIHPWCTKSIGNQSEEVQTQLRFILICLSHCIDLKTVYDLIIIES